MNINWIGLLVFLAIVILMMLVRRAGQIPADRAQELLRSGAALVDVRTAGEFSGGHLQKAINIPLSDVEAAVPRRFPDREEPILLHCQSGMRSGAAQRKLRALGYANAFNLGSYARAMRITDDRG
jgi:phage shock protein E